MQKLNLPEYSFRIKNENGKEMVFDELRRRFVKLTPEEWVRQNFVRFLITEKKFPPALIAVEAGVNVNNNPLRADLIVFGKDGQPVLAAEFKAPSVKISQDTFNQIVRYNMNLKVGYLIVSNGLSHFCCRIDYPANSYQFLQEIPNYPDLIQH